MYLYFPEVISRNIPIFYKCGCSAALHAAGAPPHATPRQRAAGGLGCPIDRRSVPRSSHLPEVHPGQALMASRPSATLNWPPARTRRSVSDRRRGPYAGFRRRGNPAAAMPLESLTRRSAGGLTTGGHDWPRRWQVNAGSPRPGWRRRHCPPGRGRPTAGYASLSRSRPGST